MRSFPFSGRWLELDCETRDGKWVERVMIEDGEILLEITIPEYCLPLSHHFSGKFGWYREAEGVNPRYLSGLSDDELRETFRRISKKIIHLFGERGAVDTTNGAG